MSKFCDLNANIKHIGEVSTSRVDGSPTGAEILTSTNGVTGDVRDTLDGKFKKMDQQFQDRFNTLAPVKWTPNTLVKENQSLQVFEHEGLFYLPNVKKLPFTTGASFNADNWVLTELVTKDDIDKMLREVENTLYVGVNQKFKTITSAVEEWQLLGKPKTIINIDTGEYNESIRLEDVGNNLFFVGESPYLVRWYTTTGYYKDAPLHIMNTYIKGICFESNFDSNPAYVYTPLLPDPWGINCGGAYGLHCDFGGSSGDTIIDNCIIKSSQNAGLGSGTRENQRIILTGGTEVYSYTRSAEIQEALDNGAMLYHTTSANVTGQHLIIENATIAAVNTHALEYWYTMTEPSLAKLTVKHTTFNSSTVTGDDLVRIRVNPTGDLLTTDSAFNNCETVNYDKKPFSVFQKDGSCIKYADLNDAVAGSFMAFSGDSDLNLPSDIGNYGGWLIGDALSYKATEKQFVHQIGYAILGGFRKYTRTKTDTTWSEWVVEGTGMYSSEVNNLDTCGTGQFFVVSKNGLTGAHFIDSNFANEGYAMQIATGMDTGAVLTRYKRNGIWTAFE